MCATAARSLRPLLPRMSVLLRRLWRRRRARLRVVLLLVVVPVLVVVLVLVVMLMLSLVSLASIIESELRVREQRHLLLVLRAVAPLVIRRQCMAVLPSMNPLLSCPGQKCVGLVPPMLRRRLLRSGRQR